ncbi:MAG: valine--tRNA ligase [Bdellovibrionales bacterium]|nr:valine--tRNA ligase [Bdellovibrionales bacterium]
MSENQLSDRYSPQEVEDRIYQWWMKKDYFRAEDKSTKIPFCIILPPPNVTGFLHMGHALDHTIQDVLIRWKRMSGYNALWVPGTDHAGIATQAVVEKLIYKEEKKTRHDYGREAFVEKIWQWKNTYGERIYEQMKKLGDSVDWDRKVFTLDEGVSQAVRKVFVQLYKKGQIYKGEKLVNWSSPLQSAISDLEVVHKDVKSSIWHIRYPIDGSDEFITIATTRPETMLGDTAVCVHPEDERYAHLVGRPIIVPLALRKVPIIADAYVDKEFGSGALKVTPAHDFNDYELGKKHKLPFINILNKDGTLNDTVPKYAGLSVQEARKRILIELEEGGFLVKTEPISHSVGFCDRTGAVVEPFMSEQWFARMKDISAPARHAVENGSIQFEPEMWVKTYLHWMNNIQDWCVSRQLWWGHRIPAWNCSDCQHITVEEKDPTQCEKCGSKNISQEEDVLDTWFSSALWPFSTLGWPNKTEALKTFYPTDVLVTGHDIIFFWVARMIMMGVENMGDVPFRKVYVHGLIRDSDGRKMSKSLGNSIDPVELINESGADALRFTLMAQMATGKDLKFSMERLEGYRNFINKLWNATRFSLQNMADMPDLKSYKAWNPNDFSTADKWLIYRTQEVTKEVDTALNEMRISDAANALYSFVWHELCDWYLEFSKPVLYKTEGQQKQMTQLVLAQTLNRVVRLLHPFIPFVTEEIYQKLPNKGEACIIDDYPTVKNDSAWLSLGSETAANEMKLVMEIITTLRNIRGENQIKPGLKMKTWVVPSDEQSQKIILHNQTEIMRLANLEELHAKPKDSLAKCAVAPLRLGDIHIDVIVPLEGLVDIEEEIKRLKKAIEKVNKDVQVINNKLGNEKFMKNAPADIVEKDQALLVELKSKITGMEASLKRLGVV